MRAATVVRQTSIPNVVLQNGDRLTSGLGFYLSPAVWKKCLSLCSLVYIWFIVFPKRFVLVRQVESLMSEVLPSHDPFDDSKFDPIAFINTQFPTEGSLSQPQAESGEGMDFLPIACICSHHQCHIFRLMEFQVPQNWITSCFLVSATFTR